MNVPFVPSSANFVLAKVGAGQEVFGQLQRRGVITRPMGGYELPEWIRISVGTPAENQRCVKELRQILQLTKDKSRQESTRGLSDQPLDS
jgi:histidinol-phosphate aminotransferase